MLRAGAPIVPATRERVSIDRAWASKPDRAVEMPGPWKEGESKNGFPPLSTAPWKSREEREIPTFPQPGFAALEKWKTKSRFPTFPPPLATMTLVLSLKKPRKDVGRCAASLMLTFQDHPVSEPEAGFRIILRLENAPRTSLRSR